MKIKVVYFIKGVFKLFNSLLIDSVVSGVLIGFFVFLLLKLV